jgi:hypothetical protein
MTIKVGDKEYESTHAWFKEMESKRNPIARFIDDKIFKEKSWLGFRPTYGLTHPHETISELARRIKWAYQRVYRGWDDRVVWSIDIWLNSIMPSILTALKDSKMGIPFDMFDGLEVNENGEWSKEQEDVAKMKWDMEINRMIVGFLAAQRLLDLEYVNREQFLSEKERLTNQFEEGMNSFTKNYFSLWD